MSAGQKSRGGGEALPEFTSFYLQQATQEFAEALDKVRAADDFKDDALPILIKALQQGTALFSPAEQRRIVAKGTAPAAAVKPPSPRDNEDVEMADAGGSSDDEK